MEDCYISRGTLIAATAWIVGLITLAGSWGVMVFDLAPWQWWVSLGFTSTAFFAVGATFLVRAYLFRLAGLIRHTAASDAASREGLQAVR